MPIFEDQLIAKATGIVNALSKLTQVERNRTPGDGLCEDYNRLRKLVLDTRPALVPLMPPELVRVEGAYGQVFYNTNYTEIHAYCEQIIEMLRVG